MNIRLYCNPDIVSDQERSAYKKQCDEQIRKADLHREYEGNLGWMEIDRWASGETLEQIRRIAQIVREKADVLAVVGIGGSNQSARAVDEALAYRHYKGTQLIYPALYLSAAEFQRVMTPTEGKSVMIDVIAKNFKTLEPSIFFRILRNYLARRYGAAEARSRIITTPTYDLDTLDEMSRKNHYFEVPFPADVGGRYAVFTPVGLLPLAAAGIQLDELIRGAKDAQRQFEEKGPLREAALQYALMRNLLYRKGFDVEVFAIFEPCLQALAKWWRQLFGESEGKNQRGIFPVIGMYTEELHSLGQYMQEGKRHVMETFLHVAQAPIDMTLEDGLGDEDELDYLEGKTLNKLNEAAYEATLVAHSNGGVPCQVIEIEKLDEYHLGMLMYTMMRSCYYSSEILGVNPFDQPGVEAYKTEMFRRLQPSH